MSCDFLALANAGVQGLSPYQGGKPIEELQRELGLSHIVKLASNENPLGPSAAVLEAINSHSSDIHRYPDGNAFSLKQALSSLLTIESAQLTLGNGSNDVLDLVAQVFLGQGSSAVISEHSFVVYSLAIQAANAEAIVVPASNWGHDLEAMAASVRDDTRVMFIANPNNPTGTWVDEAALRKLLDKVPEHVVVVLDEAYFEYVDESEYPDGISLLSQYPNLIVTRTFSKAYGLAGLRVGYSVSSPELADLLNRVRGPFNVNSLALAAAEAAIADSDYLLQAKAVNKAGLSQLEAGLDKLGLSYIPSVGNFLTFEVAGGDATACYEKLLHQGVIVRPIGVYGMPDHLRVSVGLEEENDFFLAALSKVL
ncbi:MAG: histidinol-phosphate transaminase [Pseudomonadales bacterium]